MKYVLPIAALVTAGFAIYALCRRDNPPTNTMLVTPSGRWLASPRGLNDVRMGMREAQVEALAGKPYAKGTNLDRGLSVTLWSYGDRTVVFYNGYVNTVRSSGETR